MTPPASSSPPSSSIQDGGEEEDERAPALDDDGSSNTAGLHEQFKQQSQKAIHNFFYPRRGGLAPQQETESGESSCSENNNDDEENRLFVEQFWKYYDDIIILSIFTQFGILFRLAAAGWFSYFDGTFREDSALFVNLPLNSLSSFIMGCLASGPDLMNIIETRFTPDHRQEEQEEEQDPLLDTRHSPRLERLRRRKRNRIYRPRRRTGDAELRQVQLLALERRIRASPSLLLFPVAKEEADLMEHYFADGYRRKQDEETSDAVDEESDKKDECEDGLSNVELNRPHPSQQQPHPSDDVNNGTAVDRDLDQIIYNVSSFLAGHVQSEAKILSSNLTRLAKVTLADGWDVGTTPASTFEDLMLGL